VSIIEGVASLTYFASKMESGVLVNAGDVTLVFSDCVASKYFGSEPEGELYPGWNELGSEFCEIVNSQWVAGFMRINKNHHHYVFCLNHQVFECIAKSYSVNGASSEQNS
jgi:hypothetical protein